MLLYHTILPHSKICHPRLHEVSQRQSLMTPGLPPNTAPIQQQEQQQQQPQLPNLCRPPPSQPQLLPPVYDFPSPKHATLTNSNNATPLRTETNQPTRHWNPIK